MALTTVTVRGVRMGFNGRFTSVSSETQGVETTAIRYFVPALCKSGNSSGIDTLVNSKIYLQAGSPYETIELWVTETVSAIAALT